MRHFAKTMMVSDNYGVSDVTAGRGASAPVLAENPRAAYYVAQKTVSESGVHTRLSAVCVAYDRN